jgi:hypothetical protein
VSEEKSPNCIFENERVTFKSYSDEFTPELYKEFDLKAERSSFRDKDKRFI